MAAFIQYPAHDIRLEGIEVDVQLPKAFLLQVLGDTDVRPRGEGQAALVGRLSRSGQDIVVRGRLVADVELPCVRCLDPAAVDVRTELALLLHPVVPAARGRGHSASGSRHRASGKDDEYEFSAAEADVDVYDGETVILDAFVREAILLEVPAFPLCRDECPGLEAPAAEPEVVEALDPRLAPLSVFRQKDGPATIDDLVAAAAERAQAMGKKPIMRINNRPGATKRKKGKK